MIVFVLWGLLQTGFAHAVEKMADGAGPRLLPAPLRLGERRPAQEQTVRTTRSTPPSIYPRLSVGAGFEPNLVELRQTLLGSSTRFAVSTLALASWHVNLVARLSNTWSISLRGGGLSIQLPQTNAGDFLIRESSASYLNGSMETSYCASASGTSWACASGGLVLDSTHLLLLDSNSSLVLGRMQDFFLRAGLLYGEWILPRHRIAATVSARYDGGMRIGRSEHAEWISNRRFQVSAALLSKGFQSMTLSAGVTYGSHAADFRMEAEDWSLLRTSWDFLLGVQVQLGANPAQGSRTPARGRKNE